MDQSLSPRLGTRSLDLSPGSAHVQDFGLSQASDASVADFAEREGFILVSKDSDFFEPALLRAECVKEFETVQVGGGSSASRRSTWGVTWK